MIRQPALYNGRFKFLVGTLLVSLMSMVGYFGRTVLSDLHERDAEVRQELHEARQELVDMRRELAEHRASIDQMRGQHIEMIYRLGQIEKKVK